MSWKKEQKSLYLSYDKTYSLLQQIVNYYEFAMIKFYKLLDPVLILTDRVCLTRSKMCFIIKDSRILQKPHFTISLPSCYLLLTANYKFFFNHSSEKTMPAFNHSNWQIHRSGNETLKNYQQGLLTCWKSPWVLEWCFLSFRP